MASDVEVELKLSIDPEAANRLTDFADAEVSRLDSFYFDTDRLHLRDAGYTLRIRHDGARRIQTIKAEQHAAGLFQRREWEQEVAGDLPVLEDASPLKEHVSAAALERLEPVFHTDVSRARLLVVEEGAEIELVLDRGEVVAGACRQPVCELEMELKSGDAGALFALARRFGERLPVYLGVESKAERGYRLAGGQKLAFKAEPPILTADMSAAAAFQAIVQSCIRQFRLNEMILAERDSASAVHQARVALRRLRSAFSLCKEILLDDQYAHLKAELRWLGGALGSARNIDALLPRIEDADLRARVQEARGQAYADMRAALASQRARDLMLDLAEWLVRGAWLTLPDTARDMPVVPWASAILDRQRRKVKKRGKKLVKLDDAGRHALRIDGKKLRYAVDFFGGLQTEARAQRRLKAFGKPLENLQDALGELNDIATAPTVWKEMGLEGDISRPDEADRREALLKEAEDAYEELIDCKRFWR